MSRAPIVSGRIHRNDWFHGWLAENEFRDEASVYKAAKDPRKLADLVNRAEAQQTEPVEALSDRSIIAGRSLDLTRYLACGHSDCLTKQVDDLFSRVWHYFDKIAISGPEAHLFLDDVTSGSSDSDEIARNVRELARPIFHIQHIGAENLVAWVSKPPACRIHWKEYSELKDYQLPDEIIDVFAAQLLKEGKIAVIKRDSKPMLGLRHPELFSGGRRRLIKDLHKLSAPGESLSKTLARSIVEQHWAGTASDLYTANSIRLPVGLGIGLEARMAGLRRDSISASEVAFNLVLPVVDGLPVKELIALRESENDAFEGFRDSLTQAIKERLSTVDGRVEDVSDLANELRADVIDPALHRIRRRLRAAEGLLQKNHRYNIAIAGLATVCGIFTSPDIATAIAAVALTGTGIVETQFASEKRDIALEDMYFLWKAKEYSEKVINVSHQRSRKR